MKIYIAGKLCLEYGYIFQRLYIELCLLVLSISGYIELCVDQYYLFQVI